MAVGDIEFVCAMLDTIITHHPPNDYPEPLRMFLGRRVWLDTFANVRQQRRSLQQPPLFIKPATRLKAFEGFVYTGSERVKTRYSDLVWCSDVVQIVAEYRVFVTYGVVRGVVAYDGDSNRWPLDMSVVHACVEAWHKSSSGSDYDGYVVDFGVINDGRTLLIEVNDGFAFGGYGVSESVHVDVLLARWSQLFR
jgi:hypothetical protein